MFVRLKPFPVLGAGPSLNGDCGDCGGGGELEGGGDGWGFPSESFEG